MTATQGGGPAAAPLTSRARSFLQRQFIVWGILPVLLIGLIAFFALREPRFLSSSNILNVARQLSFLGIIALGQMLYLITRNYDLSNGANVALASIVCASVMSASGLAGDSSTAIILAVLAGLLVGVAIGLINGVLVAVLGISSFMVTLGVSSGALGFALLISGGVPVSGLPEAFTRDWGTGSVFGMPVPFLIMVGVLVVLAAVLTWTRFGRNAYAVGGNASAAFHSGVDVRRTTILAMVFGSVLAALVGVMITARVASGEANVGVQYPLLSIVAAVLGGVSLYGGEGRTTGVLMGALFIVVLSNGMDLIRIQSYVQGIVLGALLVLALITDRVRVRMRGA